MFEADSQSFASAPSVPRGLTLKFWGPPSAGTIEGPWEEGGSQPTHSAVLRVTPPSNPPPPGCRGPRGITIGSTHAWALPRPVPRTPAPAPRLCPGLCPCPCPLGPGQGMHQRGSQHTNYWAPRTRKRHQQEHRPQRPTESSDPTQHAEGRTGDRPGPRKETTTRRNVTQGGGGGALSKLSARYPASASCAGRDSRAGYCLRERGVRGLFVSDKNRLHWATIT